MVRPQVVVGPKLRHAGKARSPRPPPAAPTGGRSSVSDWLSRTVKEQKDRQNTKIIELWLACKTQEEIAEAVGLQRATVDRRINGEGNDAGLLEKYRQNQSSKITFADDFTPPIYNIWKQQEKSEHQDY